MLTMVNICGRQYILRAEIARFMLDALFKMFGRDRVFSWILSDATKKDLIPSLRTNGATKKGKQRASLRNEIVLRKCERFGDRCLPKTVE